MEEYFAHETAIIDEGAIIGKGSKIWHFSHIMSHCQLPGENCNIGQNVVISPDVILGNQVKVQNNVSVYTGVTCDDDVFLGPSCVFTNVTNRGVPSTGKANTPGLTWAKEPPSGQMRPSSAGTTSGLTPSSEPGLS